MRLIRDIRGLSAGSVPGQLDVSTSPPSETVGTSLNGIETVDADELHSVDTFSAAEAPDDVQKRSTLKSGIRNLIPELSS